MELYVTLFCLFQVSCKLLSQFHNFLKKREKKRKEEREEMRQEGQKRERSRPLGR